MYRIRPRAGLGIAPAECAGGTSWFCGKQTDCSDTANWLAAPSCWSMSPASWAALAAHQGAVAPPAAPSGSVLTVPPASGADAQHTIDELVNQQMIDQQARNAAAVQSSWWDQVQGAPAAAANAAQTNWVLIAGVALAGVAAITVIGGRR